jgi:lantibiotic modifying enzyme
VEEYLQRQTGIAEQLGQVLETVREEYTRLADVDVMRSSKEEVDRYFQRLGMLRQLIGSIESFLHEEHKTGPASEEPHVT